jgi:hypothetical protein
VKAIVIYESMFGDNRQIAQAIVAGLAEAGVDADAVEVGVAPTTIADGVDLVVVGSPNHAWSMPRTRTREDAAAKTAEPLVSQGIGVREWLEKAQLREGQYTAAYDTRGSRPKAVVKFDHASASIEKGLALIGGRRVAPAEHFFVVDMKGPLQPGELERAQEWGSTLGRQLRSQR